jgi:hypothetical protein
LGSVGGARAGGGALGDERVDVRDVPSHGASAERVEQGRTGWICLVGGRAGTVAGGAGGALGVRVELEARAAAAAVAWVDAPGVLRELCDVGAGVGV